MIGHAGSTPVASHERFVPGDAVRLLVKRRLASRGSFVAHRSLSTPVVGHLYQVDRSESAANRATAGNRPRNSLAVLTSLADLYDASVLGVLASFIRANRAASDAFSRRFDGRIDGSKSVGDLIHSQLQPGMSLFDIGGGRLPAIDADMRAQLNLRVTGVDIDANELAAAPPDTYDVTIASDIATLAGHDSEADLVYSRSVAEHVVDTTAMVRTIGRITKPGGLSVHFMPNRYAPFALVNVLLPVDLRRRLLFAIMPEAEERGVFPPYYNNTSPHAMEKQFRAAGFDQIRVVAYYSSDYLAFFFPAHVVMVLWQNLMRVTRCRQFCETFTVIARKDQ